MSDLFDYLTWRGDLSFSSAPLGEIDNLIFDMIVYIDFESFLDLSDGRRSSLSDAAEIFFSNDKYCKKEIGLIFPTAKTYKLFESASKCDRFSSVEISDYTNRVSIEDGYQFCAAVFHLSEDSMFVSYRGTDDTIVGWHEDFKLSYLDEIPSQKMAVEYLCEVSGKYPNKKIYVGGHSKGGNLAVYAGINAPETVRDRIVRVYNNDGPGFSEEVINSEKYRAMSPKIEVLIPHSSLVGTMFDNGDFKVVKSSQRGLLQHDGFTWELCGPRFVKLIKLSNRGLRNELQFKAAMKNMSLDERREFVEMFFGVLEKTEAETLSELSESKLKNLSVILKTLGGLDKEQKEMMQILIMKLLDIKSKKTTG